MVCFVFTGKGHNETYQVMEKLLRKHYPSHILPPSQLEWIYVNAGGWMGAMYILHAGVTEYLMFFGTAIDTSGHSGEFHMVMCAGFNFVNFLLNYNSLFQIHGPINSKL